MVHVLQKRLTRAFNGECMSAETYAVVVTTYYSSPSRGLAIVTNTVPGFDSQELAEKAGQAIISAMRIQLNKVREPAPVQEIYHSATVIQTSGAGDWPLR